MLVVRQVLQCLLKQILRRLWTSVQLLTLQQSKAVFRSSTSSTDSEHLMKSRKSKSGIMMILKKCAIWMLLMHSVNVLLILKDRLCAVLMKTTISSSSIVKLATSIMKLFRASLKNIWARLTQNSVQITSFSTTTVRLMQKELL